MAWGDAANGYLAIDAFAGDTGAGYVLRTSDGGRTWRPQLVAPSGLRRNGVLATAAQTGFALADGNQLLHTNSGGDAGDPSTITVTSLVRRFRKPRRVTITGAVSPGVAGAEVQVSARPAGGGAWTRRRVATTGDGTFTARLRVRRSTIVVAQWLGQPGRAGDGSGVLTIRRVR
jgi:hypothetical protein